MTPTDKAKRSDSLYYDTDAVNRRNLCDMIANREADIDDLRKLASDALACVRESSRGFATHPKAYRDLRSRARKLGVDE